MKGNGVCVRRPRENGRVYIPVQALTRDQCTMSLSRSLPPSSPFTGPWAHYDEYLVAIDLSLPNSPRLCSFSPLQTRRGVHCCYVNHGSKIGLKGYSRFGHLIISHTCVLYSVRTREKNLKCSTVQSLPPVPWTCSILSTKAALKHPLPLTKKWCATMPIERIEKFLIISCRRQPRRNPPKRRQSAPHSRTSSLASTRSTCTSVSTAVPSRSVRHGQSSPSSISPTKPWALRTFVSTRSSTRRYGRRESRTFLTGYASGLNVSCSILCKSLFIELYAQRQT